MPGAAVINRPVSAAGAVQGFYGKLPARGDFVRAGLPRSFIDPWDAWLQQVIAGSRAVLGERWLACWMEAPIWRFALPAGQCGPDPVLGVWLPSVDAAGRHFPLTLAAINPPIEAAGWLAAAQEAGLDALQYDLAPEALAARLADVASPPGDMPNLPQDGTALWWTEGSPFVQPGALNLSALPDIALFAAMLFTDDAPANPPDVQGVRE